MRILFSIIVVLLVMPATLHASPPATSLYERLSRDEQIVVDTILDVFKRNHLFFLPELSDMEKLVAATARTQEELLARMEGKEVDEHDHSNLEADGHQDEHLDIIIDEATPDKSGKYLTPVMPLGGKKFTYQGLYTVVRHKKSVSVKKTITKENTPERIPAEPDQAFVKDLAARLKGKITKKIVIDLP